MEKSGKLDDVEANEYEADKKKYVSKRQHDEAMATMNKIIDDQKWKTNHVKQRLGYHLFWTYGIFWSAFIIFLFILNLLAGAFMLFHTTMTVGDDGISRAWFAFNDFPYAVPAVYFFCLWIAMFVFLVIIGIWGLCYIEEITVFAKDE